MKDDPKQYSEFAIGRVDREYLKEAFGDDLVMYPEHDNAIIGVVERCDIEPVLCYNLDVVIQNLIGDGMTEHEAFEYVDAELVGMWAGDRTPCMINMMILAEENTDGT